MPFTRLRQWLNIMTLPNWMDHKTFETRQGCCFECFLLRIAWYLLQRSSKTSTELSCTNPHSWVHQELLSCPHHMMGLGTREVFLRTKLWVSRYIQIVAMFLTHIYSSKLLRCMCKGSSKRRRCLSTLAFGTPEPSKCQELWCLLKCDGDSGY